MNRDWRDMGMLEYAALLAAWNEIHDPDAKPEADHGSLKRFMTAHESVH